MERIKLTREYKLKPFDLQKIVSDADLTLGELFEIVNEAESEFPAIAEALGMPNFYKFYSEIKKGCEPDFELKYIELYWHPDYCHMNKNLGLDITKAKVSPQMNVHAIGEHYMPKDAGIKCPPDCKEHNSYAIEFSALNEIAHLPIKLNPVINYNYEKMQKKLQITVFPSLYQVINSIFYELTFAGCTPEEIKKQKEELEERADEAKERIEEDPDDK